MFEIADNEGNLDPNRLCQIPRKQNVPDLVEQAICVLDANLAISDRRECERRTSCRAPADNARSDRRRWWRD